MVQAEALAAGVGLNRGRAACKRGGISSNDTRKCKCRWCATEYALTIHAHFPDLRTRDLDNVAKSIADALNSIAYRDDRQVCELHVYRHLDKERPRAEITLVIVPAKSVQK